MFRKLFKKKKSKSSTATAPSTTSSSEYHSVTAETPPVQSLESDAFSYPAIGDASPAPTLAIPLSPPPMPTIEEAAPCGENLSRLLIQDDDKPAENDEVFEVIEQVEEVNGQDLKYLCPYPEIEEIFKADNDARTSPIFVEKPRSEKEVLNILVMGITGVGKSTWINAIGNYVTFKNFGEAVKAEDLICVIPSKFSIKDGKHKSHNIEIGTSNNEVFNDGESATQDPMIFQFETRDYIVNIIDTPGVGDTRGREQDDENVEKILKVIAPIKKLHAICVLLKSGDKRMTEDYVYCINRLMQQLHRDAAKNFAFFFTHNLSDSGDAEKLLEKFLSDLKVRHGIEIEANENNKFFVENEGFRVVGALHNGVPINHSKIAACAETWKESSAETDRFLDYAASLEPHDVENTLSINQTRDMLLKMAEPLANINKLSEENIKLVEERKTELQETEETLAELKKHIYIPQITIVTEQLESPRTVCESCIEYQKIANTDQYQKFYRQVCCENCRALFGNMFWCSTFSWGTCTKCGCSDKSHSRISFNQKKVEQMVEDVVVKEAIGKNEDVLLVKKMMIEECDKRIREIKDEQKTIIAACAQFALFLKNNAIVPRDDPFEKFFERSIEEEERCIQYIEKRNRHADRSKLNNLKCLLTDYRKERSVMTIESSIEDINKTKSVLFDLKHNGTMLHELFNRTIESYGLQEEAHIQKFEPSKYKYSIKRTVVDAASAVGSALGGFFGFGG